MLRVKTSKRTVMQRPPDQHPQCAQCLPAKCCRYFSLQVDTPVDERDFDDLLWMIAHEHVSVYVDDKEWYLMIHTQCHFLDTETNMCKIYEKRPHMCREHLVDDCEWHGGYDFEEHFKSHDDLKKWIERTRPF
jgi:Fe-S-cluster containining protein